jgi:cytochrome c
LARQPIATSRQRPPIRGSRYSSFPRLPGFATIRSRRGSPPWRLGTEHGFAVDSTEDAGQKPAFERYIRSGGGFVGIHSASDTEYQWPWYGSLVGAYFASHPAIQRARILIENPNHPSTKGLPAVWERTDEWYNFRSNPRGAAHVLATLDESTYSGGAMGADHPIAWCQEIDGGRSWYTAMGHTAESYAEPLFRLHLLGGIESAAGFASSCPASGENKPQN